MSCRSIASLLGITMLASGLMGQGACLQAAQPGYAFQGSGDKTQGIADTQGDQDPLAQLDEDSKVRKLFESFRDGTYRAGVSFPALEWNDMPDLIKMAASDGRLDNFPVNPISSQRQTDVHEGTLALWLVEGLRKGSGHPSLNPLCFSKNDDKELSWQARSDANHPDLEALYSQWWADASEMDEAEARKLDPLKDSDLRWY